MPYSSVGEVPRYVPSAHKKQWMDVWNSAYSAAKKKGKSDKEAEQLAFAEANGVIKKETKSMTLKREVRNFTVQFRAESKDGKPGVLEGHAAMFNSLSRDLGGWKERVMPGAFTRALKNNQDVHALINHDPSKVIGRVKSGTLDVSEDKDGLHFRAQLPNTSYAHDLAESVARGDMDQCSFGFVARNVKWTEEPDPADATGEKKMVVRELHDVDLHDVSPVTFPAYDETDCMMRSIVLESAPAEFRSLIEGEQREKTKTVSGVAVPMSKFAYVGDPNDLSTWKLPIHDKNHAKNALARFNQTDDIPADKKAGVLRKIKAAAKKFGVNVSEENSVRWGFKAEEFRDMEDGEIELCGCGCQPCKDGDCQDCADTDCDDENCDHEDPSPQEIKSADTVTIEERDRLIARLRALDN